MKLNHDLLDNYCNHLYIFLNPSLPFPFLNELTSIPLSNS
jgi:hypothetical protein